MSQIQRRGIEGETEINLAQFSQEKGTEAYFLNCILM
jgi:hypothetical protein